MTLYYLYYLNAARRSIAVRDKQQCKLYYANKELATQKAIELSLNADYPIFISEESTLDGMVDGKTDSMLPTIKPFKGA